MNNARIIGRILTQLGAGLPFSVRYSENHVYEG